MNTSSIEIGTAAAELAMQTATSSHGRMERMIIQRTEILYRCEECNAVSRETAWDFDADYKNESWQGHSICPVCRHDNGGSPTEVGNVEAIPRRDSS